MTQQKKAASATSSKPLRNHRRPTGRYYHENQWVTIYDHRLLTIGHTLMRQLENPERIVAEVEGNVLRIYPATDEGHRVSYAQWGQPRVRIAEVVHRHLPKGKWEAALKSFPDSPDFPHYLEVPLCTVP